MENDDHWDFIISLEEKYLKGGYILSEWASLITREADKAYISRAYLACILTAVAGIETYLRSEYGGNRNEGFSALIDASDLEFKSELHVLRKYRNSWVHVVDPWNDDELLTDPVGKEDELKQMAEFALDNLARTIFSNPWV